MSIALNDEQRLLQEQVRSLFADMASPDSLRATIEAGAPWSEPLWRGMAELGVLGAGIPEIYGGVGLGPVEVGLIAQEAGRAVAPAPFSSSICQAAEALMIAGTAAQKERWLPRLASGEAVAAFAWAEGQRPPQLRGFATQYENGKLGGVKWPVADAVIADVCVVAATHAGKTVLALVELKGDGVRQRRLRSIDELRHFAEVTFDRAPAELMDAVDGEAALAQILDRAALFAAFEQVGGAEGALFMARDHVLSRHIFGRPLGSYQSVKHALANIYARSELAACNALYAAQALATGAADASAAAITARISATEVYEHIARENLQYHGGIGFTWEGNCHFHYRRARTLALELGSVEHWSDRLISTLGHAEETAQERTRRAGKRSDEATPEDAAYRAKAREWIAANRGDLPLARLEWHSPDSGAASKAWTVKKHKAGYSAIALSTAFGGAGGTRREQAIFADEEATAGIGIGVGGAAAVMALAAIEGHGTEAQRQKWMSVTYRGEVLWCQLFSEPGAGSDLAAVRTKAVRQGDKWIVNGQKVWTSGGQISDFGILLARTNPDVPKHQGLSFFLIDMRQPGVTTRPIRQINGQREFTETFFVDAEVPDENRLGAEGGGWAVAMTVLAAERTTTRGIGEGGARKASSTSARSLMAIAASRVHGAGNALASTNVRRRIAQFHAEAQGIKNFTLRMQRQAAQGGPAPVNIPVIKLSATNRIQQIQAFLMDLDECGGIVEAPDAPEGADRFFEYLTAASSRIAGGADEILRNQLAERALGLPGDARADKDVPFSQLPY